VIRLCYTVQSGFISVSEGIVMKEELYETHRNKMVTEQIIRRGIDSKVVINAFLKVPRHHFVDQESRPWAYEDYPLSIGCNQTISQPYIVALMTDALDLLPSDKVLEIGTGSGYQSAILAEITKQVFTIERIPSLQKQAISRLESLGYDKIKYHTGNGYLGWEQFAPYDKIIVTACAFEIPQKLLDQLTIGGKMVIPVGDRQIQKLLLVSKKDGKIEKQHLCYCRFVTMVDTE